jgi:hypothetical protein
MSAAESAAHDALKLTLEPLAALFGGNTVLDILANPGLVPEALVQEQFVGVKSPQGPEGAEPKLLGSLSTGLQALFASIGQAAKLLHKATTAFETFHTEHQKRHDHNAVDELYSAMGTSESEEVGDEEGGEESVDQGCVAVNAAHATLRGFAEILDRRRQVFWGLINDRFPDAGNMSITAARTVVETAAKSDGSDLVSQLPPGLAEALMGGGVLGGLVEVKIGSKGSGGPLGGLLGNLSGLLRRRRGGPGGPN